MASIYGTAPSIDEVNWSRLYYGMSKCSPYGYGLVEGLTLAPAAGTRTVSLSAGWGVGPGVVVELAAQETTTYLAAEASTRYDRAVLDCNWAGAGSVTLTVIKGTASATPTLPPLPAQVPGDRFRIPVGTIRVRPGVTVPTAADITLWDTVRATPLLYPLPLPGGWSAAAPTPMLTRVNGRIELWGHMEKTGAGSIALGSQLDFGTVVPEFWRPRENTLVDAVANLSAIDSKQCKMLVRPNGTLSLFPVEASITQGQNVRMGGSWTEG